MKKFTLYFSFVLLLMGITSMSKAQSYYSFNYHITTPVNLTFQELSAYKDKSFINEVSTRGWSFEGRSFVTDVVAVGGYIGYTGFFEKVPRATYNFPADNRTVTATQFRYTYALPILVTAHGYIGHFGGIRGFAGVGLGTSYLEQENILGLYSTYKESWNFTAVPEIGGFLPFGAGNEWGATVTAKYFHIFRGEGISYLSTSVGISYLF